METKLFIADAFDVLSCVLMTYMDVSEANAVMDIIYKALLAASILAGLIIKVVAALQDKKITKEELDELGKSIAEAKRELAEITNKKADDDKEENNGHQSRE